jgi:hypothetical protein
LEPNDGGQTKADHGVVVDDDDSNGLGIQHLSQSIG